MLSRAMCPLAEVASSAMDMYSECGAALVALLRTAETRQAMNMRAAEAIVKSAPKPIKILPIREVWSQVEGGL